MQKHVQDKIKKSSVHLSVLINEAVCLDIRSKTSQNLRVWTSSCSCMRHKELHHHSRSIVIFLTGVLPWVLPASPVLVTQSVLFLLPEHTRNFQSFFSFNLMTWTVSFSLCYKDCTGAPSNCAAGRARAVAGHLRQLKYCQRDSFRSKMHIFLYNYRKQMGQK